MIRQRIRIEEIHWLTSIHSLTDMTSLMRIPTMHIQLIITIKSRPAERTQRMSLESTLINRSGIVITLSHMLLKLFCREQFMLVCKHLFMFRAKIANHLPMSSFDMSM
jgi:hypothetical protein